MWPIAAWCGHAWRSGGVCEFLILSHPWINWWKGGLHLCSDSASGVSNEAYHNIMALWVVKVAINDCNSPFSTVLPPLTHLFSDKALAGTSFTSDNEVLSAVEDFVESQRKGLLRNCDQIPSASLAEESQVRRRNNCCTSKLDLSVPGWELISQPSYFIQIFRRSKAAVLTLKSLLACNLSFAPPGSCVNI